MTGSPQIVVRLGPTGPRAGLADGPDVWEIVRDVDAATQAHAADPLAAVCEMSSLSLSDVELALAYYAAHRAEIDQRIRMNEEAVRALLGSQSMTMGEHGPLP